MADGWTVRGAAALTVLGAAALSLAQETYRDNDLHWQIDLPKGWVRAPEIAAEANAVVSSRTPGARFRYVASFKSPGSPYLIMQFTSLPMGSMDLDTLESQLGAGTKLGKAELQEKFSDVVSKVEIGKPVLDRARNRIITRIQATDQTGTAFEALSVGFLAKDGVIQANCYAPASEFAQSEPEFEAIVDSIRIDPAFVYVPPPPRGGFDLLRALAIGAVCGGIGGVVAQRCRKRAARQDR